MTEPIRVTVWNEFRHEKKSEAVKKIYPDGIHAVIAAGLRELLGKQVTVQTATLDEPEHGLTDEVLANTDVLTWWGHCAHRDVADSVVDKVAARVLEGMGLIVLHSGHYAKVFKKLMGTGCHLYWREAAERERIWTIAQGHPITEGLEKDYFELEHTEMYGEPFDIPQPDELVFISWFEGGDVFRSGCVFRRGAGRIFYFRPGHETFPIYYDANVRRIIANATRYVAPVANAYPYRKNSPNRKEPLSPIASRHKVDESLHRT
ncbi:MAG: ThuA domain-containing protein [Phycisphaeraceae bacterium]|nr:ThuA domain-containing protein [Phycisphaeraceae bacterium]